MFNQFIHRKHRTTAKWTRLEIPELAALPTFNLAMTAPLKFFLTCQRLQGHAASQRASDSLAPMDSLTNLLQFHTIDHHHLCSHQAVSPRNPQITNLSDTPVPSSAVSSPSINLDCEERLDDLPSPVVADLPQPHQASVAELAYMQVTTLTNSDSTKVNHNITSAHCKSGTHHRGADAMLSSGESCNSSESSSSDDEDYCPKHVNVSPNRTGPRTPQPPTEAHPGDSVVGILYDQLMEEHVGPEYPEHYEQPQRIMQVHAELEEQGLLQRCWMLPCRPATDTELARVHTPEHITEVDGFWPNRQEDKQDAVYIHKGADLYVCSATAAAARMAAGCCVQAVQNVLDGTVHTALAVVRPPGHHAECARAQGFCFFNNCTVAAREALQHPGINKVLILDWDVHHGNGIQHATYEDPDIMYISIHRDPKTFYPYHSGFVDETGEKAGEGYSMNIPWIKRGMGDPDYKAAFDLVIKPVLSSWQPDFIIVAAGFDAAEGDPLGGCKLTPAGYAAMTKWLLQHAHGRLVMALEGGYNTRVTAECVSACVEVLLTEPSPPQAPTDSSHMNGNHVCNTNNVNSLDSTVTGIGMNMSRSNSFGHPPGSNHDSTGISQLLYGRLSQGHRSSQDLSHHHVHRLAHCSNGNACAEACDHSLVTPASSQPGTQQDESAPMQIDSNNSGRHSAPCLSVSMHSAMPCAQVSSVPSFVMDGSRRFTGGSSTSSGELNQPQQQTSQVVRRSARHAVRRPSDSTATTQPSQQQHLQQQLLLLHQQAAQQPSSATSSRPASPAVKLTVQETECKESSPSKRITRSSAAAVAAVTATAAGNASGPPSGHAKRGCNLAAEIAARRRALRQATSGASPLPAADPGVETPPASQNTHAHTQQQQQHHQQQQQVGGRSSRHGIGSVQGSREGSVEPSGSLVTGVPSTRAGTGSATSSPAVDNFVVTKPERLWPTGECIKTLRLVCQVQSKYWPCLNKFNDRWEQYQKQLEIALGFRK